MVLSLGEDKIPDPDTNPGRLARISSGRPLDCNVDTKIVPVMIVPGSSPSDGWGLSAPSLWQRVANVRQESTLRCWLAG